MSTGPTGPYPDNNFTCKCISGNNTWAQPVSNCGTCDSICRDEHYPSTSVCTPNFPSFTIFITVFLIIIAIFVIGYYALWFYAIKSTVNKLSSSKKINSKNGGKGTANIIIVILFILGALLSFLHPFSGTSFIFFLVIGVFIYSGGKSDVKSKKTKSYMISLSQVK